MILKFSLETNIPPPCPIALLVPTIGFGHPAEACISATTLGTGRKLGALQEGKSTMRSHCPSKRGLRLAGDLKHCSLYLLLLVLMCSAWTCSAYGTMRSIH